MLVVHRKAGQSITIGEDIQIAVLRDKYGEIRLGIKAPEHIKVIPDELTAKDASNTADEWELGVEQYRKRGFTEQEAAEYTGMSRAFLRQARMNGKRKNRTPGPGPKYRKLGCTVRYLKEDLDAWFDQYGIPDPKFK